MYSVAIQLRTKAINRLKNIAIRHKKYLIPLVKILGADLITGGKSYDSGKETIIIVTHEASQTGAPILALSLCKNLSKKYNIITILLRGGTLADDFIDSSKQAKTRLTSQASLNMQ